MAETTVRGRLVLDDRVAVGTISVDDGLIAAVEIEDGATDDALPYIAPGFVDIHVHGWGGFDAMGGRASLDGMARGLLRRGVTSFLPTAVTAPLSDLAEFAETVRAWRPSAPDDGAEPLGFNLEGPFLAESKRGAHDPTHLIAPSSVDAADLEPLLEGLRVITIAPELPGAIELIALLDGRGVIVSLGHSAATAKQAEAAYAAGARSTTHVFNAMTGVDHRHPGLAVPALLDDEVWVELIADGIHVDPALWPLICRLKPADRLLLVSDALAIGGTNATEGTVGGLNVEVRNGRVTLAGTSTLAGCAEALDIGVRNLALSGIPLNVAVAAATRAPLGLLGVDDRGRLAAGQRADLVELDDRYRVRRAMRAGSWFESPD
jgi:N-acetylglucosamine-6-phosphate deacetylase